MITPSGQSHAIPTEVGESASDRPRVCFLYMGLHKTASSTLQKMVLRNIGRLAEAGVYVPEASTRDYRRPHHDLAKELNAEPGRLTSNWFNRLRTELVDEGRPARLLLTSENFSNGIDHAERREWLRAFFDDLGYRLRLIVYLRPQDRSINSTYTQHVKFFQYSVSIDDYVQRVLEDVPVWFDYCRLLAPVLDDGGLDCDVRPFNRATLEGGIEADFLAAVGVPPGQASSFARVPPANRSPGPKTVAACLEIARRLASSGATASRIDRRRLFGRLRRRAGRLGWQDQQFSGISPEMAASIRSRFAEGNDLLSKRVWARPWGEVFAYEVARPVPVNRFDPAAASPDEQAEYERLVEHVWQVASARLMSNAS